MSHSPNTARAWWRTASRLLRRAGILIAAFLAVAIADLALGQIAGWIVLAAILTGALIARRR